MIEIIGKKIILDENFEIREYDSDKGSVRALVSNEGIQSILYVNKEKRNELALDYFNFYNLLFELNPKGKKILMLGGGGFSYPHYCLSRYKDKNIDIVEINKKCIEYAKKYFYLDELLQSSKGKINVIIEDAVKYIQHTTKKYDYILIDLFEGKNPIREIYEEKNVKNLKKILNENGIILINYIMLNKSTNEELKEIIKITNNYKVISNNKYYNKFCNYGNIIIILSEKEINIPNNYNSYKEIEL